MFKLLVPDQLPSQPDLGDEIDVVLYDSLRPVPSKHADVEGLVVWGNTSRQLQDSGRRLRRLRWVQTLASGADAVLAAGFSRDIVITNGAGLHNGPVAEHGLALILAAVRRLDLCVLSQKEHVWREDLRGISYGFADRRLHTLSGAQVTIWGLGEIGLALAELLQAMGSVVVGVGRVATRRNGIKVVARQELEDQLAQTDLLVMLLPSTTGTDKALDGRRISALRAHSWVVNLGRGSTVDEIALAEAVGEQRIGGCALDVFDEEPLSSSSPLWDLENVIISPHAAGGRPIGFESLIRDNVTALLADRPLRNVVRFND